MAGHINGNRFFRQIRAGPATGCGSSVFDAPARRHERRGTEVRAKSRPARSPSCLCRSVGARHMPMHTDALITVSGSRSHTVSKSTQTAERAQEKHTPIMRSHSISRRGWAAGRGPSAGPAGSPHCLAPLVVRAWHLGDQDASPEAAFRRPRERPLRRRPIPHVAGAR